MLFDLNCAGRTAWSESPDVVGRLGTFKQLYSRTSCMFIAQRLLKGLKKTVVHLEGKDLDLNLTYIAQLVILKHLNAFWSSSLHTSLYINRKPPVFVVHTKYRPQSTSSANSLSH